MHRANRGAWLQVYSREYASWLPGELFFRKGPPGPWSHHLHVMEPFHPRWETMLVFRDYLRAHPEAARAYADIKRALAASSKDNHKSLSQRKKHFRRSDNSQGSCMARGCRRIAARNRIIRRKISFCEIFGVVQFSTFATTACRR